MENAERLAVVEAALMDFPITNLRIRDGKQVVGRLPGGTGFAISWLQTRRCYQVLWPWPNKSLGQKVTHATAPRTAAEIIRNVMEGETREQMS